MLGDSLELLKDLALRDLRPNLRQETRGPSQLAERGVGDLRAVSDRLAEVELSQSQALDKPSPGVTDPW